MRIKYLLRIFSLFILFSFFEKPAEASHLYGSEFTYEYVGPSGNPANPFRYRFFYKIYSGQSGNISTVTFQIYQKNGTPIRNFSLNPALTVNPIPPSIPPGCVVANVPNLHLWNYQTTQDLPLSFDGYYITATINARNGDIDNLNNPGSRNLFTYMMVPSPLIPSKSPVFTDTAVVVMFTGDTTTIVNSAFDTDGDKLIYSFNNPYENTGTGAFTPELTPNNNPGKIPYAGGYSLSQPFGVGGYASINASTGLAKYYVPVEGNYVISFQVKEYRNVPGIGDVLIGTTIRDIQLVVRNAPANTNTKPSIVYSGPNPIVINEGEAIPPITFTFTDPNPGNIIKITASSASLLDGPGNKNATFNTSTTSTTINGPTGTTATFNYTSVCGEANLGGYPLNITATDGVCGTSPDQITVTVIVTPYSGPEEITGDTTVCTSGIENYSVPSKASATYRWRLTSGGSIVGSSLNPAVQVQWTTPGRHKLTAIETSTGNCIDSVSFFVNVAAGVNLNVVASATTICVGTPVTLTATGGTTYTWSYGTNTFIGSTLTVTPTTIGNNTFSVSGPGITGCSGQASVVVNVNPLPTVAGVDKTICSGQSTTLQATGGTTYVWTDNNANTYTGNNISVSPTVTTTYSVVGTNTVTGCSNTDNQVTITVTPLPTVAGVDKTICAGQSTTLQATGANTYTWTVGTTTLTGNNISVTPTSTTTYTLTGTNTATNCSNTDQVTITVTPLPTVVGVDKTICAGQSTNLQATGADTYTWAVGTTTLTGNNISVTPVATTTYTLTGTNTVTGCSNTDQVTVTVNPLPTVAGVDKTICAGQSTTLQATGADTYTWTVGTTTLTGNNISITPTSTITYSVVGTNSSTGCSNTDNQVTITVTPLPTVAGVDKTICAGQSTTLQATGADTYTWTVGTTTLTGNNVNVTPTATTTYTLTGTNTVTGCSNTDLVTIAVTPLPTVAGVDKTICAGQSTTLQATGADTYSWTVGTTTLTGNNVSVTPTATTTYTLTGTNTATNCSNTDQVTITVNPLPTVAGVDKTICAGQSTTLQASGADTYTWTVGTTTLTGNNISITPTATTTYSVIGTNTVTGCTNTDNQVTITVTPLPTVTGVDKTICAGQSTTLQASGADTYTWSDGINNYTGNNVSITPAVTTTYSVTGTNHTTTCSNIDNQVTITVNPLPTPLITNLNAEYCANDPVVTLTSNMTSGTTSFTINGTTVTTLNPALLGPGTYTVGVSNLNSNNCTGTASQQVIIKPVPVANFGALANSYCKNDPAFPLNNITGSSFQIDGVNATSLDPSTLAVGPHKVKVTTTSPNLCSIKDSITVTIKPIPAPSLAFLNATYCANDPIVTLPGGTGGNLVNYSINGVLNQMTFDPATLGPGTYIVSLKESTAISGGCEVTISRTIIVNPVPLIDPITGPTSVCPGITGIKYRIVNPRQTSYQWAIAGNGTIVAGQGTTEITVNWGAAANATISVQARNSQGCLSAPATLPVTINPILITPQPAGPVSVCENLGTPVRYVMNNPTPGSTFSWSVTGGNIVGSSVNDTIFVNWPTAGTFSIVVNESSTGSVNCFGSSTPLQVKVLAAPNRNLQVVGPTNVCENSGGNYALNGDPGSTYVWSQTYNGVTTPLSGTGSFVSLNFTLPGQYTITALETNAANCTGTPISKVVTVTPQPVVSQIIGPKTICPENLNNLLYHVNGPANYVYYWMVTGGTVVQNPLNTDSVYVTFDNDAIPKSVSVIASVMLSPSVACMSNDPFTIPIIIDRANLQLASVSTAEQNDKAIELTLNMPNNSANRQNIDVYRREAGTTTFTKVGTVTNTQTRFTDNGVQTGEKVYEYQLKSANECGTELTTTVHNSILMKATSVENSKNVNLTWNEYKGWGTNGVDRYEIYLKADNGDFKMVEKVDVFDKVDGTESITLRNITGQGFNICLRVKAVSTDNRISWSNTDCLGFENKLKFYNVFTPNNDNANDNFVIENILLYPGNELSVYNRWGNEVYRKKDYDNTWNGKDQNGGTYYYLLKLSDGTSFKGWVEIIK